jgi:Fe-S oxidoreductase
MSNAPTLSHTSNTAPDAQPQFRAQIPLTPVHLDHERMMDCIHCGLCLSQCPTYAEEGVEADSPRGRIYLMRALAEGRVEAKPDIVEHFDLCLGCRACETACPSGVQYGHLIEGTRAHLREHYKRPWKQRAIGWAIESTFPYPERLDLAMLPIRILRNTGIMSVLHKSGFMKLLGNAGEMERMLPPLPPFRSRLKLPEQAPARGEQQAKVGMITGCVMPVMQTHVNEATMRVLTKAGCAVDAPRGQACCGALHAHSGDLAKAKELAKHNIELFEKWEQGHGELDAVVINAAGCGAALKEYEGWLQDDPAWAERARNFTEKVRDVSEYLAEPRFKDRLTTLMSPKPKDQSPKPKAPQVDVARETIPNTAGASTLQAVNSEVAPGEANRAQAQIGSEQISAQESINKQRPHQPYDNPEAPVKVGPTVPGRLTYHDACHLAHGQGIRTEPRDLVQAATDANGEEFVPLRESDMCCGSAGIYNITQPEMAMQLLQRKMQHIADTGAEVVVSANPGCTMQLKLGAYKFKVPVQVLHPVEVLDEATGK